MDQDEDLLGSLLAVATEELEKLDNKNSKTKLEAATVSPNGSLPTKLKLESKTPKKCLKDTDIFEFETNLKLPLQKVISTVHSGDTDSSDDEGNRNYEDQKYNQYGREIKSILSSSHSSALDTNSISSSHYGVTKKRISTWARNPNSGTDTINQAAKKSSAINSKHLFTKLPPETENKFQDVFMDPIFGMRIVNPLISSSLLQERMQGRLAVRYSDLPGHMFSGHLKDKDWVICGAVVNKSPPKTSNKGSQYSIWTLSDLKDDIKSFPLFMFNSAHTDLWKTSVGTVIGVLNPSILDQKDETKKEVTLSVSNAQKIMIFGHSKDFGICKSMKKNGDKCTAIVNLSRCEYCIYHIKQEYQKCSKRSELQANFAGQGLVNLRNKVLGKNEVFYAGKSYTAIRATKSKKLEAREQNLLQNLNGMGSMGKTKNMPKNKKGVARHLDVNPAQRARDLKLLEKLGGSTNLESKTNFTAKRSDEVTLEESKATALSVISNLKAKKSDLEEHVTKSSQYNLKSDLFVNVENKNTFSCNISEEVSLKESKSKAIAVISKLKAKSKNCEENKTDKIKNSGNENLLSLAEIEDQLNSEELNYSDGESELVSSSDTVVSKLTFSTNKVTHLSNDITIGNLNGSSLQESLVSGSSKSREKDNSFVKKSEDIVHTPKSVKCNIESFGKISPKLSETGFNPNSMEFSSPKSILSDSKKYDKNRTPLGLKPTNLKQTFSNNSPESSVTSSNGIKCNERKSYAEESLDLNDRPSASISEYKNTNTSILEKPTTSSKSISNGPSDVDSMVMGIPILSGFGTGNFVDLSKPITSRHVGRAKVNAIKYIQRTGPIKKVDPNSTKRLGGKKRNIDSVFGLNIDCDNANGKDGNNQSPAKKSKLQESEFISDRFKKMMAMTSKYAGLLEQHDDAEKEKYFKKLEVKEQMEEKMTNTHKVKCKAVRCLQCKYTSFSASELCKNDRHPLKVFDAMKRFYKCSNCQNRTVTLELIPTRPCNNCGSSKWEKTGMMKEKIALVQHNLSIRGGEQKFVNSVVTDASLDLLVPDD